MKVLRFFSDGRPHYGVLVDGVVYQVARDQLGAQTPTEAVGPLSTVRLLAPCVPTKILAVGLNYEDPEQEGAAAFPEEPIVSFKPPSSVIATGEPIVWPTMSKRVDFEGELAIVIGQTARDVPVGREEDYILGVTCANDVTARDIQRREGQWAKAKGFDTFCPLGPMIETEVDLDQLQLTVRIEGEIRQSAWTRQLHYKPAALIGYLSRIMTLYPGDVLLTGTPPGFGPLRVGDTVEVSIDDVGTLRNTVASSG